MMNTIKPLETKMGAYASRLEKIEKVMEEALDMALCLPSDAVGVRLPLPRPLPQGEGRNVSPSGSVHLDLARRAIAEGLEAPIRDMVGRGGKRWRPLLLGLVCEALGGGDAALRFAPLVECAHNASLIHDDIEDNSTERRGKPAAQILYGLDTAINAGSYLYFAGLDCLLFGDIPPKLALNAYRLWGLTLRSLHQGQAMDIAWHRRSEGRGIGTMPGPEDYALMCAGKTGALAYLAVELGLEAAATALGAWPADAPSEDEVSASLCEGAQKLGLGFQILDDVKNLDTGNPGKKRGDDIVEGKRSYPLILYLSKKDGSYPLVERCMEAAAQKGIEAPEIEELIQAITISGALEEARREGTEYIEESCRLFNSIKELPTHNAEALHLLLELPKALLA
jgi:octaprenyl-diphosphate synthase